MKLLSLIYMVDNIDLPWANAKNKHKIADVNILSFCGLLAPEIRQFKVQFEQRTTKFWF